MSHWCDAGGLPYIARKKAIVRCPACRRRLVLLDIRYREGELVVYHLPKHLVREEPRMKSSYRR